jgi:hypothetical protein
MEDVSVYQECMRKVKQRIETVLWLLSQDPLGQDRQSLMQELTFLQFRKVLELIAFASLTANKEKYARVHANFGSHWRAKDLLSAVQKLNPAFYPIPLETPTPKGTDRLVLKQKEKGFLTRQEFEQLYDTSSEILHMRNPFSSKDSTVPLGYSIIEWATRIQSLMSRHLVRMVDGDSVWLVTIPSFGDVEMIFAKRYTETNNPLVP